MKRLIFLPFCCVCLSVFSQIKFDYTWPLGYGGAFGSDAEYSGMLLGFNQNSPSLISQTMLAKPIAFICDSSGDLRLYFNGCMLANGQHEIIENSDGIDLGGDFLNPPACESIAGANGGYQSALILPLPGSSSVYYLFYMRKEPNPGGYFQLFYAIIDMSENNGAGKVILKNQLVESSTEVPLNPYITAARHGNGRDWWVVCPTHSNMKPRLTLLLSPEGLQEPLMLPHPAITFNLSSPGQIGFTADGNKFFIVSPNHGLEIQSFNRCTGELYDWQFIDKSKFTTIDLAGSVAGAVSSPNSRFLYISSGFSLWQMDLWADPLVDGLQQIGQFDGFASGGNPATFYQGALGPDGKIYFGADKRVKHLHVIQSPNSLGAECDLEQHAFTLPAYQSSILPNFVQYRLQNLPESPCDTLSISSIADAAFSQSVLKCFPNPSTGSVEISLPEGFRSGTLSIMNAAGQIILSEKITGESVYNTNLKNRPTGLYSIVLRDQYGKLAGYSRLVIDR